MSVAYSPLCDSNLVAYLAYCLSNGSGVGVSGGVGGGVGYEGFGGDCHSVGELTRLAGTFGGSAREAWLAVLGLLGGGSGRDCAGCGRVESGPGPERCVSGLSGGCVGGGSGSDVCGDNSVLSDGGASNPVDTHATVVSAGSDSGVGGNLERNRAWRKARKEKKARRKLEGSGPEWRKKFASGELADSWEARKICENRIAVMKAEEEIKKLESGAGNPRLQPKVLSEEEQAVKIRADYEAHMERRRNEIAKSKADQVYWTRRAEAGAVDKAIALEMEIMDGQISGKYDPFASKRTVGWARTVKTNSSAGSSAKKTVWSGSGASGVSKGVVSSQGSGTSVVSMEKYLKDLELKEKEVKVRVGAAVAESKAKIVELGKEVEGLRERTKKTVSLDRYNLEVNFLKRKCAKDAEIAREQGLRGIRGHIVM